MHAVSPDALPITSPELQLVAPVHDFKFSANSVFDRHGGPNLKPECWQHRTELVNLHYVVTFGQHIAAPVTHADHETFDFEIGRLFPLSKNVKNASLGLFILDRRA